MKKGLFMLSQAAHDCIYGESERDDIFKMVDIYAPLQTKESIAMDKSVLKDVELIFSGWEAPLIDKEFIANAPNLKAVFYGSGSTKFIAGEGFFDANILLTSAYAINAIPVAEYCLSQILFCLKRGYQFMNSLRQTGQWPIFLGDERNATPGNYGSTVGIISLGAISRKVIEFLSPFNINIMVSSGYLTNEEAADLGVTKASIEEIFEKADVISLHSPDTPRNKGLITAKHFLSMKPGASFINTARGAIVRQNELIEVIKERSDLVAVLDVTDPEPPAADSVLYRLPNIIVTPHIAGSTGKECSRMGRLMVEELERYLSGKPLKYGISKKDFEILA